jgi:hypothetical protein
VADERTEKAKVIQLVVELQQAYNDRDFSQVVKLASEVLAIDPSNGLAYYAKAAANFQERNEVAFFDAIQEGLAAPGSSSEDRGDLLALGGRFDRF